AAVAQAARIDALDAGIGKQRADQRIERRSPEPPGEPVPGLPVRPVAPDVGSRGKYRIWPRVPGPQMDRGDVDHASAKERRHRIMRVVGAEGRVECTEKSLQRT